MIARAKPRTQAVTRPAVQNRIATGESTTSEGMNHLDALALAYFAIRNVTRPLETLVEACVRPFNSDNNGRFEDVARFAAAGAETVINIGEAPAVIDFPYQKEIGRTAAELKAIAILAALSDVDAFSAGGAFCPTTYLPQLGVTRADASNAMDFMTEFLCERYNSPNATGVWAIAEEEE